VLLLRLSLPRLPRLPVRAIATLCVLLAATGCAEDDVDPTDPSGGGTGAVNQIVSAGPINASSPDTLVHFSLATNAVVPRTSAWDIAFRRYEVRLNGGVTAAGTATAYALGNARSATSAQVLALTAENTLAAFDSVRAAQIPADSLFTTDRLVASPTAFLTFAGSPAANTAAYWKVRTSTGSYALMRVSAAANNGTTLTSVTIETRAQGATALGAATSINVPLASAPVAVSLATGAVVTPSGCNWDVQVNPVAFTMSVNAACTVGTSPGPASPTFTTATAANDAPQYAAFLAGLSGPIPNSITDPGAPFRYNLAGTMRLHPTFNTFLVRSGSRVYKLQVIDYYNASGASGYPTIRSARIQ
jgi:hypothetical protein